MTWRYTGCVGVRRGREWEWQGRRQATSPDQRPIAHVLSGDDRQAPTNTYWCSRPLHLFSQSHGPTIPLWSSLKLTPLVYICISFDTAVGSLFLRPLLLVFRSKSPELETKVVDQESVWVDVIGAAMRKDSKWVGMKNLRPHFQNLGLYVRALESIKILKNGELQRSKPYVGSNHEMHGFVDAFDDPETMNNADSEGEKKSLRAWTRDLFKATIMQAKIIITTCSNSATNLLRQQFSPSVVIVDEAAMAKELETLLPAYHVVSSMKLAVLIRDPKQLPPTVTSKHKTVNDERNGKLVDVFADQMEYSPMTRLYDNDDPTFMLDEQHRMAPGLSSCSHSLFY